MAAIVGSGDYRYEIVESWPKMPKYWSFGGPSDAAVNSDDEVYVFSRGVHPVDDLGHRRQLHFVVGRGQVPRPPRHPRRAGRPRLLTDMYEHVVTKHAPGGERLLELGMRMMPSPAWDARPFNMPTGVASMPDGGVVVSDGYGGHRVHRFDADGNLALSWGEPAAARGSSRCCTTSASTAGAAYSSATARRTGSRSSTGKAASSRSGPTSPARATCGSATWSTSSSSLGDPASASGRSTGSSSRAGAATAARPRRVHVVPRRVRGLAGEHLRDRAWPRQGGEAATGVAGRRARWPGLPNVDPNGVRGLGRGRLNPPSLAGGS